MSVLNSFWRDLEKKEALERILYFPRGAVQKLWKDKSDELLLAGPAGTGKSLGILQKCHALLSKYPKSKGFMARKTRASMTNSCLQTFDNHVLMPQDEVHMHKQDQQYNYPNGSMFAVIGLDDPERIKSTDWDFGFIQEATECSENDVEIGTTRLRNWKIPYQQLMMDCNPDRPNHWLKKRSERIDEKTGKPVTKLIQSWHEDNPRLYHISAGEVQYFGKNCEKCKAGKFPHWSPEGEKYLGKLERLSGARKQRLFKGLWVSSEGMVYEDWDPQIHVISKADLPHDWWNWPKYWVHDWGYEHPLVWQEWCENPRTGQLYLLRQIFKTHMLVEDLAQRLKELTFSKYIPSAILCDHDAQDRAVLERHTGYMTLPAYKDITTGIQAVQRRLRSDWCDEGPGLFIVRESLIHEPDERLEEEGRPYQTQDEFDGYVWDKKKQEKLEEADRKRDELPVDKDNHGLDAVRYMVAFADNLADDPQEFEAVIFNDDQVLISPY